MHPNKKFRHYVDIDKPVDNVKKSLDHHDSLFISRLEQAEKKEASAQKKLSSRSKIMMINGNSDSNDHVDYFDDYESYEDRGRFEYSRNSDDYDSWKSDLRFRSSLPRRESSTQLYSGTKPWKSAFTLESQDFGYTAQAQHEPGDIGALDLDYTTEKKKAAAKSTQLTLFPESFNLKSYVSKAGASSQSATKSVATVTSESNCAIKRSYHNYLELQNNQSNPLVIDDLMPRISWELSEISADTLYSSILSAKLQGIVEAVNSSNTVSRGNEKQQSQALEKVPHRFMTEDKYLQVFQPLLLSETKHAINSHLSVHLGDIMAPCDQEQTARGSFQKQSQQLKYHLIQIGSSNPRYRITQANQINPNCPISQQIIRSTSDLVELQVNDVETDEYRWKKPGASTGRQTKGYKDDLVLLFFTAKIPVENMKLSDLLKQVRHTLGVITTSSERDYNSHNPAFTSSSKVIAVLSKSVPSSFIGSDKPILCVPVIGLTSFIREWSALLSITNANLLPLAPYILNAAPVVSLTQVSALNASICQKVRSLESIGQQLNFAPDKLSQDTRIVQLCKGIVKDVSALDLLRVDSSVLKKSKVGKTIRNLTSEKNARLFVPSKELVDEANLLMAKWKRQIEDDHCEETDAAMKGGNQVAVKEGSIDCPQNISSGLWQRLNLIYNKSQLYAIKNVCSHFNPCNRQDTKISLIQGPPGTGKTLTILGMISVILAAHVPSMINGTNTSTTTTRTTSKRLLICTPSNTAVDEIILRILTAGIFDSQGNARKDVKVVRLGDPLEGAPPEVLAVSVDKLVEARLSQEPIFHQLLSIIQSVQDITIAIRECESRYRNNSGNTATATDRDKITSDIRDFKSQLAVLKQQKHSEEGQLERVRCRIRHEVISSAEIVASTLSGAGRQQFLDHISRGEISFETAIIDEACQATEPSTLIPLRYGCKSLVLVGDPRQLPSTVLSPDAQRAGLGISLFERLEKANHEVIMLTVQYRMHPDIRRFPSDHFYDGKLTDAPFIADEVSILGQHSSAEESAILLPQSMQHLKISPINFFDLPSSISREAAVGTSFENQSEIAFIICLLRKMASEVSKDGCFLTFAIITPYKAQVNSIKKAFAGIVQRCKDNDNSTAADIFLTTLISQVEVNTIDGFQGREKDVVIFSCVKTRSSTFFLSDHRRINVAITRSKRSLIIVGTITSLRTDPLWDALITSIRQRGMVHQVRKGSDGSYRYMNDDD